MTNHAGWLKNYPSSTFNHPSGTFNPNWHVSLYDELLDGMHEKLEDKPVRLVYD
jgi:hypothetical protein